MRHCCFASLAIFLPRHKYSAIKTCVNANMAVHVEQPPVPPPPPPLMEMVGRGGRRVKGRQGHKETGVKETGDRETDRKTGDRQGTDRETGGGNKKDPPTTEMLVITDIFSSCRPTTSHF